MLIPQKKIIYFLKYQQFLLLNYLISINWQEIYNISKKLTLNIKNFKRLKKNKKYFLKIIFSKIKLS